MMAERDNVHAVLDKVCWKDVHSYRPCELGGHLRQETRMHHEKYVSKHQNIHSPVKQLGHYGMNKESPNRAYVGLAYDAAAGECRGRCVLI